jgi:hypothetical protein
MSDLTIHGVESIKVETSDRDDWYSVVKILVRSDSSSAVADFTVNLFGKPGLSIESHEPRLPFERSVVDIKEKENAA